MPRRTQKTVLPFLYQGPSILPGLFAMLLRLYAAKFVATVDVEKAFLRVNPNDVVRNATRFLWVRNISLPLERGNIITYRFIIITRAECVTISTGRNNTYHVPHHTSNEELATDLRNNRRQLDPSREHRNQITAKGSSFATPLKTWR
ncbi:unnamed protein product [Cylicostephanus goldi]|uniref:Reverse transcriptase domain-containing protein n=1 Tax=Cylicostephanus goldi TaxID=71465 RepID=A0A3P7M1G6_CYLGO|nr:unnamed protein product [Cylicostephanus goldi]